MSYGHLGQLTVQDEFEKPESGTISFDGLDMTALDISSLRQQMGFRSVQPGRGVGSGLDSWLGRGAASDADGNAYGAGARAASVFRAVSANG